MPFNELSRQRGKSFSTESPTASCLPAFNLDISNDEICALPRSPALAFTVGREQDLPEPVRARIDDVP
jgi:hypothetical protein